MITPDAAALLAQIYPIALLAVVIEGRYVYEGLPGVQVKTTRRAIVVLVRLFVALGAVILTAWAITLCVVCVTQNLALTEPLEVASVIGGGVALLVWFIWVLCLVTIRRWLQMVGEDLTEPGKL